MSNAIVVWEEIVNADDAPCETCAPYVGTVHRQGEGPMPLFHPFCQCYRRTVRIEVTGEDGMTKRVDVGSLDLKSEPVGAVLAVGGVALADVDRAELLRQLEAGDLREIVFDAVVFRQGRNANHYAFRDDALGGFASSFAGQPFLRNHDVHDIDARDGTIDGSQLEGIDFVQSIRLTTRKGMQSFLEGQIDRFSIGWYYDGVTCSVCNQDWFSYECSHWPGRKYKLKGADGVENEITCELIFENPTGKETSAVNAPAVPGTRVLSELIEHKQHLQKESGNMPPKLEKEQEVVQDVQPQAQETQTPADTGKSGGPTAAVGVGHGLANGGGAAANGAPGNGVGDEWAAYAREQAIGLALSASRLPATAQTAVRAALAGRETVTPGDVEAHIDAQRAVLAEAASKQTVKGVDPSDSQRDGLDSVVTALEALILGVRPAAGVAPLSGVREAYVRLSGDYEMHGRFIPENVGLARVNSSTMAGVVANALNKVVVNQFQQYPRWWEPIVFEENFSTLQQVRWITLGGVGELPVVQEGKAYTELTWDDQTELSNWSKRGGYLGLTLEAMDRDDTRRLQQAPRALAQAAWLTLSKAVAAIFSANSGVGPTMSDGNALFHASHNNLGSSALSYDSWTATRTAMRKQSELNSTERLGVLTAPKFLIVPPDLEGLALQILMSEGETGTANNDENPWAEGEGREARKAAAMRRVLVVDLLTDTNDWSAVADPMLYPSIGMGFRYGKTPEVFSVADANSGLMFTNDVMPVKVRWFYAVGPTDWRGMYKHNVS
ncbi:hypothetical protein GC175_04060 [bacterium]|nr:hypothetical protein [bacterium]